MNSTAMSTNSDLRDFLMLPYGELEELNLRAKQQRQERVPLHACRRSALSIWPTSRASRPSPCCSATSKAGCTCSTTTRSSCSRPHDNLTFDGSSIRGFTRAARERFALALDWSAFYWAPADIFGSGKVLVFGDVIDSDGTPFAADIRGMLKRFANECYTKERLHAQRRQRNRRLPLQGARRRAPLSTRRASSSTSTPAATITRCRAIRCVTSSIRSPKCSARWASRTKRTIRRSRRRSSRSTTATAKSSPRPTDPALQADLPPSGDEARHDRELLAQAGRRRQRQRHAHQRLGQQGRQEPVLGSEGIEKLSELRLEVRRPHPDARTTTPA